MKLSALAALYKTSMIKVPTLVMLHLAVDKRPGTLASTIANTIGASITTVSMAINALVKDGLLVRHYPYRDRRQVTVYLTDKGELAALQLLEALVELQNVDSAAQT